VSGRRRGQQVTWQIKDEGLRLHRPVSLSQPYFHQQAKQQSTAQQHSRGKMYSKLRFAHDSLYVTGNFADKRPMQTPYWMLTTLMSSVQQSRQFTRVSSVTSSLICKHKHLFPDSKCQSWYTLRWRDVRPRHVRCHQYNGITSAIGVVFTLFSRDVVMRRGMIRFDQVCSSFDQYAELLSCHHYLYNYGREMAASFRTFWFPSSRLEGSYRSGLHRTCSWGLDGVSSG
jgi:hypothetical protein